jgi:hypothetical protein
MPSRSTRLGAKTALGTMTAGAYKWITNNIAAATRTDPGTERALLLCLRLLSLQQLLLRVRVVIPLLVQQLVVQLMLLHVTLLLRRYMYQPPERLHPRHQQPPASSGFRCTCIRTGTDTLLPIPALTGMAPGASRGTHPSHRRHASSSAAAPSPSSQGE